MCHTLLRWLMKTQKVTSGAGLLLAHSRIFYSESIVKARTATDQISGGSSILSPWVFNAGLTRDDHQVLTILKTWETSIIL